MCTSLYFIVFHSRTPPCIQHPRLANGSTLRAFGSAASLLSRVRMVAYGFGDDLADAPFRYAFAYAHGRGLECEIQGGVPSFDDFKYKQ